jgi:two-component system sensor histidine kinase/response regulator
MAKDQNEARGLALGAVDYVTKPFSPDLVKARVRNQLELKLQRDALERQNEILEENARLREDIERISRHDLKTPLNSIINFPKLMQKDNLTEEQLSQLKKISSMGYKMLNMINLSLDMYKMEQGTYQLSTVPVDLVSVVDDIVEENSMLTMLRGISVDIRMNDAPPNQGEELMVKGEKLLLYSMLANIIKNAIEASPDDEQITVALGPGDPITLRVHNKGTVPEEIRETFFEKYVTADKGGGTGLGTYSAKLIAEAHGVAVRLDSSEQDGTTVTFVFPKDA